MGWAQRIPSSYAEAAHTPHRVGFATLIATLRGPEQLGGMALSVAIPIVFIYAGVKHGTLGPSSVVGLNTTRTRWPIRKLSKSQSTRFVIMVTPSSKVTYART